ncbi:histone acetyltransferase p300-like isoform X3 [Dinothrombium tinctorium]|uniref:histone acetyltransferase n=1 Tax=Dinothrombium tinctorium TaxID=1965070 RepID=A0A3S3SK42_9ACAR|nr:histone acetyltransferase p300-like isoform X3 [Dinothrombium tinctorium]
MKRQIQKPIFLKNEEKRKLIQQQLVLLIHASNCQHREQQNRFYVQQSECKIPHCGTLKSVLNHMTRCTSGKQCLVPHCANSRQIILHWKNCNFYCCPVCSPIKLAARRHARQHTIIQQYKQLLNESKPHLALTLTQPTTVTQSLEYEMEKAYLNLTLTASDYLNDTEQVESKSQLQMRNVEQFPVSAQLNQQNSRSTREWREFITTDLRNKWIKKIVQAIFPAPDFNAVEDKRMVHLMSYASKVEGDMFKVASSREEYYLLLAEKIFEIDNELEAKRRERSERKQAILSCYSN